MSNLTQGIEIPSGELTPLTSDEYIQAKLKVYNSAKGELTGYDCKECSNRGYSIIFDNGYEKAKECKCMTIRRSYWNIEKSGLKKLMEDYRLDNYSADEPWQGIIKNKAISFLCDNEKWFYIGGQVGAGKTHICTAIVGEMLKKGKAARYMLWTDTVIRLNGCVNDEEEYNRLIHPLKSTQVLYIDDFFKTEEYFHEGVKKFKYPSGAEIKRAFEILNHRYNNKLTTVISSERSLEQVLDIDQAVGSRIKQMAGDYNLNISQDKSKNYRLR